MKAEDRKSLELEGFIKVPHSGSFFVLDDNNNDQIVTVFEHPKKLTPSSRIELSIYSIEQSGDFESVSEATPYLKTKYLSLNQEQIANI
jgi:hypothetical protein